MDDFGYSIHQYEKDWPLFDSVSEECKIIQQPSLVTSEDSDLSDDSDKIIPTHHKRSRRINISKVHQPSGPAENAACGKKRNDKELGETMLQNRARPTLGGHFPQGNKCELYTYEDVLSASEEELELEIVNQFLLARSQITSSDSSSRSQQCFLISDEKLHSSRSQQCLHISTAESLHSAHQSNSIPHTTVSQSRDENAFARTNTSESYAENILPGDCYKNHIKVAKGDQLDVGFEYTRDIQACGENPKDLPGLWDGEQIQYQHNEVRYTAGRSGGQCQSTLGEDLIAQTFVTESNDSQFSISGGPSTHSESMSESLAAGEEKCKEDYSFTVPEIYEYFYTDFGEEGDQNTSFFMRVPSMFKQVKQRSRDPREINLLTTIMSLVQKYLHPTKQGQTAMVPVRKPNTSENTTVDGNHDLGSLDNALVKYLDYGGSQTMMPSTIQKGRGSSCLSCTQKDLCLFCFACASWAMKSATSQSEMWKAALLVNVSAISAVRYFRRHVQRANLKSSDLQHS
ncbi:uncharacterized protein perm1a [Heptranchias perlo]|uniref:uncharacterized protein perm1a n=1 Tax=Heptranchias perlo TaxID=212740 RepID=UPI00355A67A4